MPTKTKVFRDSEKMGERNDCSVKAIALATNTPYKTVHDLFRFHGRRKGCGTFRDQQRAVLQVLGYRMVIVHNAVDPNCPVVKKNKFKAKTIMKLEDELPSRGVFIVYTSGHMLCARAGKVLDWTSGRRHRIKKVYRVVKDK